MFLMITKTVLKVWLKPIICWGKKQKGDKIMDALQISQWNILYGI